MRALLPDPARLPADPLATFGAAPPGPSLGIVLRCHRDPGLVAAIVELVREAVDEVVVVADEVMTPQQLGAIAAARPTAIHRIPARAPQRTQQRLRAVAVLDRLGLPSLRRRAEPGQRLYIAAAIPLLPVAATAYAAGALMGGHRAGAAPAGGGDRAP